MRTLGFSSHKVWRQPTKRNDLEQGGSMWVRLYREDVQGLFHRSIHHLYMFDTPSVVGGTTISIFEDLVQKEESYTDLHGNKPRTNNWSNNKRTKSLQESRARGRRQSRRRWVIYMEQPFTPSSVGWDSNRLTLLGDYDTSTEIYMSVVIAAVESVEIGLYDTTSMDSTPFWRFFLIPQDAPP